MRSLTLSHKQNRNNWNNLDLENCWRQIGCPEMLTPLKTHQCLRKSQSRDYIFNQPEMKSTFISPLHDDPNATERESCESPGPRVMSSVDRLCIWQSWCDSEMSFIRRFWLTTAQRNSEYSYRVSCAKGWQRSDGSDCLLELMNTFWGAD